jgi:hypothetical protein
VVRTPCVNTNTVRLQANGSAGFARGGTAAGIGWLPSPAGIGGRKGGRGWIVQRGGARAGVDAMHATACVSLPAGSLSTRTTYTGGSNRADHNATLLEAAACAFEFAGLRHLRAREEASATAILCALLPWPW